MSFSSNWGWVRGTKYLANCSQADASACISKINDLTDEADNLAYGSYGSFAAVGAFLALGHHRRRHLRGRLQPSDLWGVRGEEERERVKNFGRKKESRIELYLCHVTAKQKLNLESEF